MDMSCKNEEISYVNIIRYVHFVLYISYPY